jgi:hypothetical protein
MTGQEICGAAMKRIRLIKGKSQANYGLSDRLLRFKTLNNVI